MCKLQPIVLAYDRMDTVDESDVALRRISELIRYRYLKA